MSSSNSRNVTQKLTPRPTLNRTTSQPDETISSVSRANTGRRPPYGPPISTASFRRHAKSHNATIGPSSSLDVTRRLNVNVDSNMENRIHQMEYDLAYHSYIQTLFKQHIIKKEIKEREDLMDAQILYQEEMIKKKERELQQLQNEVKLEEQKQELDKMITNLEENINIIKEHYGNPRAQKFLQNVRNILTDRSSTVVLQNVEPIDTKEKLEEFIETFKKLNTALEKFFQGRDLEGIQKCAEKCRILNKLMADIKKEMIDISNIESEGTATILQKFSDKFSEQYRPKAD